MTNESTLRSLEDRLTQVERAVRYGEGKSGSALQWQWTTTCPQCGKVAVRAYTGRGMGHNPIIYERLWWCVCGLYEIIGFDRALDYDWDADIREAWKNAQKEESKE